MDNKKNNMLNNPISKAEWALVNATTSQQTKQVEAMAAAAKAWAKEQNDFEMTFDAALIYIQARCKTTELIEPTIMHGDHGLQNRGNDIVTSVNHLSNYGFTKMQWSRRKKELEASKKLDSYQDDCIEKRVIPTPYGLIGFISKEVKHINNPDWYQSSKTDEWATPQWLFDLLDDEFGFSLDVCASPDNHKCDKYFTRDDDSFSQEWAGTCWMNPPYGKSGGTDIYDWMAKAKQSAKNGTIVVCLVPARTDTNWWWDNVIGSEIRFLKGRIKYKTGTMSPFPSAVIIMGYDAKVRWWDVRE